MTSSRTKLATILTIFTAGCGGTATVPLERPTTAAANETEKVAEHPVFPDDEFRKTQPQPGAPRDFQLPEIKTFQLKNGIEVYLIEQHALPIISASLSFDGGSINDPKGKWGRADICMTMISEGTQALDKLAFQEALADIASSVSAYAGSETQGATLRTLSSNLDATFALFADTLLRPGMRAVDFDRLVKRSLEGLKQAKGSAPSVATRVASNVLYGAEHPMGQITTESSLKALELADCKRYHEEYIKPKGARLFVVGDLNEAQIRARFDDGLKGWKGTAKKSVALKAPASRPGKIFFVDVPGAAQSAVSLLHFGPPRKADDYFATWMMSAVLGGSFSARVNMNLREDKGYTYGARGGFNYSRNYGEFTATASVRSDSTRQSVLELVREIKELHSGAKPATAEELERERNGAILGLPARFSTSQSSLDMYRNLAYYDLPLDYYQSYVDKVGQVTIEQMTAAAKSHLKPAQAIILVVGDARAEMIERVDGGKDAPLLDASGKPVTLLNSLRALASSGELGPGQLVVLDADGKIVK